MEDLTPKIGFWIGSIFFGTGLGMLIFAAGDRGQTSRQWAMEAGVDLGVWLTLGGIFLIGGMVLIAICRWPERK
ncbi:hypothetical protein DMC25_19090 [Caulobacter sp. D4A]|uniref:hypothetical protein n=1 Tax=unclassified Caulobacter TaxID=2648921 RepID=UPI000D734AB6|nr:MULTISPECIES: hypothetical protein [unclassified Caulobacter]PXA82887.1 hypothetical protein DMC25_19090 [Caulobacter sp. D4A]PXA88782.1 hypothetical protein DMC18_18510 [Caulobacter sp. D5]